MAPNLAVQLALQIFPSAAYIVFMHLHNEWTEASVSGGLPHSRTGPGVHELSEFLSISDVDACDVDIARLLAVPDSVDLLALLGALIP
jgi:hypothetical protein